MFHKSLESLPTNSLAVCAARREIHGGKAQHLETPKKGKHQGKTGEIRLHCVIIVSQDSNLAPKNDNDGRLSD